MPSTFSTNDDSSSSPEDAVPTKNSEDWTLLHRGAFVNTMKWLPQIQTLTLCRHRKTSQPTETWKSATLSLMDMYPILRGRLVLTTDPSPAFWVHHPKAKDEENPLDGHFAVIDLTEDPDIATHLAAQPSLDKQFCWVRDTLAPLVPAPTSTLDQLTQSSPLWQVRIILLPAQYYVLNVGLSHAVADSFTYYRLVDELVHAVADDGCVRPKEPILSWTANPSLVTHEQLTHPADNALMTTSKVWWWADKLNNWWRQWIRPRSFQYRMVDQAAIDEKKKELLDRDGAAGDKVPVSFLSSNDIITAALLRANRRSSFVSLLPTSMQHKQDVCIVFCNARSRRPGYQDTDAGNLVDQLILPASMARDPNDHRRVLQKGHFFEPGTLPYEFMLTASFTFLTSWATAQGSRRVAPPVDEHVCHVPHPAPMKHLPMDVAMVFQIDKRHLGIAHNFYSHGIPRNHELLDSISVPGVSL